MPALTNNLEPRKDMMKKYLVSFKEITLSEVRIVAADPQEAAMLAVAKKDRGGDAMEDVVQVNYSVEITPELLTEIK